MLLDDVGGLCQNRLRDGQPASGRRVKKATRPSIATGAPIASIDKPGTAHNTLFSDDGARVYFESQGNTRTMSVVDAKTRTIVKEIGPFGNVVRPFTFNGKETLLFANTNELRGFEVADRKTGKSSADNLRTV